MFFHGADWFVNNQDSGGGWPSNVIFNKGRKKYPGAEELEPGWYGAMCQGQAISVLVRAFHQSGDEKYLQAAENAAKVFSIPSSRGGVKAVFVNGTTGEGVQVNGQHCISFSIPLFLANHCQST